MQVQFQEHATLRLESLGIQHERSFVEAAAAVEDFDFSLGLDDGRSFGDYVRMHQDYSRGEKMPEGIVPGTFLVALVGDEVVGRVSLRHELNDFLFRIGGHIGYAVVPRHRRKGYGREMLRLALGCARGLGLTRVLVTCDLDNVGSRRIIESNGGVLENIYAAPELEVPKRRYWIEL